MYKDLDTYYHRWYHSRPVAVTPERQAELRRLHRILYRCAEHLAATWRQWVPGVFTLSEKELQILERLEAVPFRAGTWRPDYLIDTHNNLRICEITSRFFAHGIFISSFGESAARQFLKGFPEEPYLTRYPSLLAYMESLADGKKKVFSLKSSDPTSEIRLYRRFYKTLGLEFEAIEAPQVEARRQDWARPDALVVSALNQKDLLGFSTDTLQAMVDTGMVSDFRNIFLLHDKRFMALWFRPEFTSGCLSEEDTDFLRAHAIPTFLELPPDAASNKNRYILKPWRLGKSEGLCPGPLMKQADWERRLEHAEGMIVQPFIGQRVFPTVWEGKTYDDYACGMMLCVDDRFFDSGIVRFSSLPVTNVGDDRRGFIVNTGNPAILAVSDVL